MLREIRPAVVMILLMTVLTGLAYPLAMTGLAQLVFALVIVPTSDFTWISQSLGVTLQVDTRDDSN